MSDIPDALSDKLKSARHVAVLTGAGVSAESGLPTFRNALTGLWERFNPEDLATPRAFEMDPALVWGWYEWRRRKAMLAQPNPAHHALKALAAQVPRLTLVTQNVDDLHERAGSSGVLRLHGSLAWPYCEKCRQFYSLDGVPDVAEDGQRIPPPRCRQCSARIRPGVVWFGEDLPRREWQLAQQAAQGCDVFLCVGTSAVVTPAASLTQLAARAGATTVQINLSDTGHSGLVSFDLRGPAGVLLPSLVSRLSNGR